MTAFAGDDEAYISDSPDDGPRPEAIDPSNRQASPGTPSAMEPDMDMDMDMNPMPDHDSGEAPQPGKNSEKTDVIQTEPFDRPNPRDTSPDDSGFPEDLDLDFDPTQHDA
jgi:hypothetical protein